METLSKKKRQLHFYLKIAFEKKAFFKNINTIRNPLYSSDLAP